MNFKQVIRGILNKFIRRSITRKSKVTYIPKVAGWVGWIEGAGVRGRRQENKIHVGLSSSRFKRRYIIQFNRIDNPITHIDS